MGPRKEKALTKRGGRIVADQRVLALYERTTPVVLQNYVEVWIEKKAA